MSTHIVYGVTGFALIGFMTRHLSFTPELNSFPADIASGNSHFGYPGVIGNLPVFSIDTQGE